MGLNEKRTPKRLPRHESVGEIPTRREHTRSALKLVFVGLAPLLLLTPHKVSNVSAFPYRERTLAMSKHRAPVTTVTPTPVLVGLLLFLFACLAMGLSALQVSQSWNESVTQTISERVSYVSSQEAVQHAAPSSGLPVDVLDGRSVASLARASLS